MTAPRFAAVLAVLIIPATATFHAQQTPVRDQQVFTSTGTGVVRGSVVVDDEQRAPLRRAHVALSRLGAEDMRWASTDDNGQFVFAELPAATYTLSARKGGFLGMSAGAAKPGMPGRQVVLRDGGAVVVAPIALPRGAAIAGRITDSSGRPISNAQVRASLFVTVNGDRQLRTGAATWNSTTNDHGEYRIFGLPSGDFVLAAWQSGGVMFQSDVTAADIEAARKPASATPATAPPPIPRPFWIAPTLYPGTVNESAATPIVLRPGEERLGVDVALQRVPMARVTGTVLGMDGRPVAGITVQRLLRRPASFSVSNTYAIGTAADGTFADVLAPGEYVFQARGASAVQIARSEELGRLGLASAADPQNTEAQWASVEVPVNGADVSGITLRLQRGMVVSGTVAVRANVRVDLTRARVQLTPAPGVSALVRNYSVAVDSQHAFRIDAVTPGRYSLSISPLPGAYTAKSAMYGETDLFDVPFEVRPGGNIGDIAITLSDLRTELGGTITNPAGQPASHLYVLAFSQDRAHWHRNTRRILSARAGEDGSYALAGLPAGSYFLCALTEIDTTLQYEAEYLDQLVAASIKIALAEGEKKIQHLRTGG